MPSVDQQDPRTAYWRSLGELQQTPEFQEYLHREFPQAASEFPEGVSRRRWIQLMGAVLSVGAASGCRWEQETIAPFVQRPANRIPGVPQRFATILDQGGFAQSLMVSSYDGRPVKVEGNPGHPISGGATTAYHQACILNLYDPDRVSRPRELQQGQSFGRSWQDVDASIERMVESFGDGSGLRVLAESSSSPSRLRLKGRLLARFPQAKWYEYEPVSFDGELAGSELAYGRRLRPYFDVAAANVVVCIDDDLFGTHPALLQYIREWSKRRVPADGPMNRMYVVESGYTITGASADHRKALSPTRVAGFVAAVEAEVVRLIEGESDGASGDPFVHAVAADLVSNQGKSLVAVGARQSAEVHAVAHRLNHRLGNLGATVKLLENPADLDRPLHGDGIRELSAEMAAGDVEALLIIGGNPVYDAPGDVAFIDALAKVPVSIHLSEYEDETSQVCTWHWPRTHQFESWGDGRAYDGTLSVAQPLVTPLHDGRSELEMLARLTGEEQVDAQAIVQTTFSEILSGADFTRQWRKIVHDGFAEGSAWESVDVEPSGAAEVSLGDGHGEGVEVVFAPSSHVYDGRYSNNGWLQEAPDFMTKLTWDNAALVGPATAEKLALKHQRFAEIQVGDVSLELPVYVMPGQAPDTVALVLGYGRTAAGVVGGSLKDDVDPVGVNVSPLRSSQSAGYLVGATVKPVSKSYQFAITQDHFAIDKTGAEEIAGRVGELVREGTLEQWEHEPKSVLGHSHHPPLVSPFEGPALDAVNRWGMSIDLSRCIGCNACVLACQSENNVPVVGKEQVIRGREMHWLRVDRYFRGDVESPEVVGQPVPCMQCENAPCEQVCPVAATVHSTDGLNDMVYNRCVGTRYCANNCPYKVRRFNYFYFNKRYDDANGELARMVLNPEVTVRSRGVMEKCTYCVQRIQSAKITAKNEKRPIKDGEVVTACAQACPAQAIEFGDLNDAESRVSKTHADPRTYGMLEELLARPRTRFMAKIRNPHPSLAEKHDSHHGSEGHHGSDDHAEEAAHGDEAAG